jgi:hypothetical protein
MRIKFAPKEPAKTVFLEFSTSTVAFTLVHPLSHFSLASFFQHLQQPWQQQQRNKPNLK